MRPTIRNKRPAPKSQNLATDTALGIKAALAEALRSFMTAASLNVTAAATVVGCNRRIIQRLLDPTDLGITLNTLARVTTALNLEPKLVVRRRPVAELNPLVTRLAVAPDRASGDALRQQILEGFYGSPMNLAELDEPRVKKPARSKPAIRDARPAHAPA